MKTITTETGEQIQVDFHLPACSRLHSVIPASAATDTMACYNVLWNPPGTAYGADPASDWFNSYQVDLRDRERPGRARGVASRPLAGVTKSSRVSGTQL